MHKPYLLFALMIGLTLSLLGSISPEILANMPTAQTSAVQLTDQSFNPTVITITVGAQVTWENKTSQSYTLQSGSPYAVYLPIIMMNSSNKRTELYGMVIQPQELFGGNFPPNGQLTHQFQSAGTQPYFITGHPNFSGRVIILPGTTGTNTPTASATSPNQATATPTTSATSPNQATTTPTASATSPNQTTATPTASATSSNQATATPTASATSPNQTTTTPTASATSPNQTPHRLAARRRRLPLVHW
jgi:plastocyanin